MFGYTPKKNPINLIYRTFNKSQRAEEEIRTPTPVTALPPQSSASTNFATSALGIANVRMNVQNTRHKAQGTRHKSQGLMFNVQNPMAKAYKYFLPRTLPIGFS
jgi:hypothetical protein